MAWLNELIVGVDATLLLTLIRIKGDTHIGFAEMVLQDALSRMGLPAMAQDRLPTE